MKEFVAGEPAGCSSTIKTKSYGSFYLCNSDSNNYCNCDDLKLSGFKTWLNNSDMITEN